MKTLAVSDGDLMAGQSGHVTISGAAKIRQDLAMALGERLGNDRFHPNWGSTLIDFIGRPIDFETEFTIRSEVSRVLAQYLAIQDQEVYGDYLNGARSRYATADVVREVNSIEAQVDFDAVRISIALTTLAGQEVRLNRTVVQ